MTIASVHDQCRRRVSALEHAVRAAKFAELASRWVCQADNVAHVSQVGLRSRKDRQVALRRAADLTREAAEEARLAVDAVSEVASRPYTAVVDAGVHANRAEQLEQRVRAECADAGLRFTTLVTPGLYQDEIHDWRTHP